MLDQLGIYNAPSTPGNAVVEVATEFWATYNGSKFTLNDDDSLTVISNGAGFADAKANFHLTQAGDYVEVTAWENNPFWITFDDGATNKFFGLYLGNVVERFSGVTTSHSAVSVSTGDKIKIRLNSGGKFEFYKNNSLIATSINSLTGVDFFIGLSASTSVSTVINKPFVSGTGITGYEVAQATVSIQLPIDSFLQNDPLIQYMPKAYLQAWHAANKVVDDGSSIILMDLSQNNRPLMVDDDLPEIQEDIANNFPGVYFDGTNKPLVYEGELAVRHIFIVASFDGSTFSGNEGLLSDLSNSILCGAGNTTTKFLNIGFPAGFEYRIADVEFSQSNQSAPMDNIVKVIEVRIPSGLTLDGIQIGQDKNLTARKWEGIYLESVMFEFIKTDYDVCQIYQYFAMKYHLWQENADGLFIFPFHANSSRPMERGKETYLSEPYSGDMKALVRDGFKRAYDLSFDVRSQAEYEAAEVFVEQHHPLTHYIFRDTKYYPPKDVESRIASSIKDNGSDTTFRFNYSFQSIETS